MFAGYKSAFKFILLMSLLLSTTACIRFVAKQPVSGASPAGQTSKEKTVTHHRVAKGETLYSIAFQYGHDYRDIARWNNIGRSYTIFPRQRLRVVPIEADAIRTSKQVKTKSTKPPVSKKVKKSQSRAKSKYTGTASPSWRWPTRGKIISSFSYRDPGRRGIDISGHNGQAIYAAADGTVVYQGNGLRGYGNLIILKHNEMYFSAYAHNKRIRVKENEKVKSGQRIADMGNTGTDNNKLHFEIRRAGKPVNPLKYLPKRR